MSRNVVPRDQKRATSWVCREEKGRTDVGFKANFKTNERPIAGERNKFVKYIQTPSSLSYFLLAKGAQKTFIKTNFHPPAAHKSLLAEDKKKKKSLII